MTDQISSLARVFAFFIGGIALLSAVMVSRTWRGARSDWAQVALVVTMGAAAVLALWLPIGLTIGTFLVAAAGFGAYIERVQRGPTAGPPGGMK